MADPAAADPLPALAGGTAAGTTSQLPTEPRDLWDRLQRGMAMPALTHPLVAQHAARFAANGFFDKRADRIRLYLPLIIEEIEQRGLPLELAMLPLVESALNPHARSPVGALGFWQFMQPTARRFELRTSRLVDDRKNLRQATRAALDYLQKLHAQFGDWHLAMAAYNWGEGRVQAAVNRQRLAGRPADFNALAASMPDETRHYVPQIMALAQLVADPQARQAHQASLPEMPNRNPLVEVDLRQDTDLSLALRFSGISQAEFLNYNPAARPPVLLAAATPRLLLPEAAARRFEAAQAEHQGKTASYKLVRLTQTQPVDAIAQAHGASAASVRAANDIPRGMKPMQGSVLLLPAAVPAGTVADGALVAHAELATAADVVQLKAHARRGESPQALARRCAVPVVHLVSWNGWGGWSARRLAKPLGAGTALTLWVQRESPGPCAMADVPAAVQQRAARIAEPAKAPTGRSARQASAAPAPAAKAAPAGRQAKASAMPPASAKAKPARRAR